MNGNRSSGTSTGTRNGLGVASLVMGVAALTMVFAFLLYPLGGLVAIVAVIIGAFGMARAARGTASNRGQALAGVICGVLALVLAIAFTVRIGTFAIQNQDELPRLTACMNTAATDEAQIECLLDMVERLEESMG